MSNATATATAVLESSTVGLLVGPAQADGTFYAVAPQTTETPAPAPVAETTEGHVVRFYRQRANGTTRHVPLLAEGTDARADAEWVQAQRDEGRTMKAISAEVHLSVPTLRRMLTSLALTEECEDPEGEWADVLAEGTDVVFGKLGEEDSE